MPKFLLFPIFLIGLVSVFLLFVRYLERTSVFYPSREMAATPLEAGMRYEDVHFAAKDGTRLHGWYLKKSGAKATVLYFHGNAGNISHRVDKIRVLRDLGFNVFIFDYRGYGKSAGRPSEQGFYSDGMGAFSYLLEKDKGLPVIFYGASIGGAVAIDVAAQEEPAAVIIEAAFTSAEDMARVYYPWVPSFMISIKFDSLRKIGSISGPKLFFYTRSDEIIPFEMGERLFQAAGGVKRFVEVHGGHNDNFMRSEEMIRKAITAFVPTFLTGEADGHSQNQKQ